MSIENFGLKAKGPCFDTMFLHGVPRGDILESVIDRIDLQLNENSRQLEDCMREIIELSSDLMKEEHISDPIEGLSYVCENHLLEKHTCYDPDLEVVAHILRQAIKCLDVNPGSEDTVLQSLLTLSSTEGITLPPCSSTSTLASESVLSLHLAVDQTERVVEVLWNDLCLKLRRHYVEKLSKLPTCLNRGTDFNSVGLNLNASVRLFSIQSLCSLFPHQNILVKYHGIRQVQLEACLDRHCKRSSKISFQTSINSFVSAMSEVMCMMTEDLDLFNAGVFHDINDTFTNISEIYFDCLEHRVASLVDKLYSELPSVYERKERISKSPSDVNFLSRRLRSSSLRREDSKSLENVPDIVTTSKEQNFTDLRFIPEEVFNNILHLSGRLLQMERFIYSLHNSATWQTTTCMRGNSEKPRRLKSALKTSQNAEVIDEDKNERNSTSTRIKASNSIKKFSVLEIVRQMQSDAPPEALRTSEVASVVHAGSDAEGPVLEWRSAFQHLTTDIVMSVNHSISSVIDRSFKEDVEHFEKTTDIESASVKSSYEDEGPRRVTVGTLKLVNELDRLLPLALAGIRGPLAPVRAAYITTITTSIKTLITWIIKLSLESLTTVAMRCRYVFLASLSLLSNRLQHYDDILKRSEACQPTLSEIISQVNDSMKEIQQKIIDDHYEQFACSILHDAESHKWTDQKEFFEGERCSFDVQMWNYVMQCLRADLWCICSASHARHIFTSVLQLSLSHFAWRYARVTPSRSRTKQFCADITAILICTSDLLFYSSSSIIPYLDPYDAHKEMYSIHNSCSSLLSCLAIAGSPLDLLHKTYKKGFNKRLAGLDEEVKGYHSQWLAWLRPSLLPRGKQRVEDLPTSSAIYLQLCILHSQHSVSYQQLIYALLLKQCSLSILLLTYASNNQTRSRNHDDQYSSAVSDIYEALIDVLIKCQQFTWSLSKVLIAEVERLNDWNIFGDNCNFCEPNKNPRWMPTLFNQLKSFFVRVSEPGIRLLLMRQDRPSSTISPLSTYVSVELPCGCPPIGATDDNTNNRREKDLLAECMYSIMSQLVEDIFVIPLPVLIYFRAVQEKLTEKHIRAPFHCAGLKLIAAGLKQTLSDIDDIEKQIGTPVSTKLRESLLLLSECVYHLLTSPSYEKTSSTPRVAGLFMKANKNWISEQIETITEYLNNDKFETSEDDSAGEDCSAEEYLEEVLLQQRDDILDSSTGKQSLSVLYNFVWNNHNWIVSQLDIPTLLNVREAAIDSGVSLSFDFSDRSFTEVVNPLTNFDQIRSTKFDQMALMNFKFDWSALLQSDLGLSQLNFRNLLHHRHDMQEDSYLEDSEKRLVDTLRKNYDRESDSFSSS